MSSRAADSVETMAATMPALRDNDDVHFGLLRAAVESRVTQILEKTLGRTKFTAAHVPGWLDRINTKCLQEVVAMSPAFKVVVTTLLIEQGRNAGLHVATGAYMDDQLDGTLVIQWNNGSVAAVVTVLGCAI